MYKTLFLNSAQSFLFILYIVFLLNIWQYRKMPLLQYIEYFSSLRLFNPVNITIISTTTSTCILDAYNTPFAILNKLYDSIV